MSYPLTSDEYLLIKENLLIDKFSNWESFLLTTGITSLISGFIFWATGTFEQHEKIGVNDVVKINISQIIILIIYGGMTIGTIFGFFIFQITKKKSQNPVQRLDEKITNHINKNRE